MSRPPKPVALSIRRVGNPCAATIPYPEQTARLEAEVRIGDRGRIYRVVSYADDGSDAQVWAPVWLMRRRPMRRCGLRDAILVAFRRLLASTRPSGGGAS